MTLSVDLFWSFRSPYSYLATPRLVELEAAYDLEIVVRPVYPIAVRQPAFFSQVDPLWVPYLLRDTQRLADFLGLPFHWPRPDPIAQDLETRAIAAKQPLIRRLTRLGVAAVRAGHGLAFLDQVSRLIFGGTENWHEGGHLASATAAAGLDLAALEAAVAADVDGREAEIEENQQALAAAGHWGVPTLAFQGEPFFGQDRIELCLWRMRETGLQSRS